jgi:hypothetical protein
MYRDFNEENFLGYAYQSSADYKTVKTFYLKYFADHGWQLSKQKDGGWGPSEIEFRNDRYRVTVYDKGESDGLYGRLREAELTLTYKRLEAMGPMGSYFALSDGPPAVIAGHKATQ